MTDPATIARRRALAAERQRRYRARRRANILVHAEMERFGFVEALVETGRLGQWDEDDRAAIDQAVTVILSDWHVSVTRDGVDPIASDMMRRRGAAFTSAERRLSETAARSDDAEKRYSRTSSTDRLEEHE